MYRLDKSGKVVNSEIIIIDSVDKKSNVVLAKRYSLYFKLCCMTNERYYWSAVSETWTYSSFCDSKDFATIDDAIDSAIDDGCTVWILSGHSFSNKILELIHDVE